MDSQESILDVSYQSHSDNNTGLQAPITTEEPPEKIEDQVVSLLLSNFGYNNRGLITQVVHDALLTLHTGTRQSQPVTTLLDDIPHTVSRMSSFEILELTIGRPRISGQYVNK